MTQSLFDRASETAQFLLEKTPSRPLIGVILGSGLGAFVNHLDDVQAIPYEEIPGFFQSTVVGHAGKFIFAKLNGQPIIVMQGRVHYYEINDLKEVTFPIRVLGLMGIKVLVVTNSAGAINSSFEAGDLMMITDHLNFIGTNPLIGSNDDRFGPRFPDMSEAYNKKFLAMFKEAAKEQSLSLKEGVYCGLSGPSYETPAEIRMLQAVGGDAVGMSTIPEVIVANHMGIRCVGISCLSNLAAGLSSTPLSHSEVKETAERVGQQFIALLENGIKKISKDLSCA